jgi:protein O-mannosyl-transferase
LLDERLSSNNEQRLRFGVWALTIAAYCVALTGPFQFDDSGAIVRDASVHGLSAAFEQFGASLRPILDLSYALSWAVGSGATWPFHAANLLLHLINIELVMRLATAALNRSARWPFRGLSRGAALTGAVFALHPIQTEAVTYITGRSSSLSTVFTFAALMFYVAFARGQRRLAFYIAAVVAFILAIFTKELSATLPLALLLWELCIEQSKVSTIVKRLGPWFVCGLLGAIALVMHPRYFALLLRVVGQRSLADSLSAQVNGIAYLAAKLTLFERPCIDPGLGLNPNVGWVSWVALVGLAIAIGLPLWFRRSNMRSLTLFGLVFFLLQVFIPYILLPRADVINERHAYAGAFGLFLPLGALWQHVTPRGARRWQSFVPAVLCAALASLTAWRNVEYRSELSLWQATIRCAPKNARAFNNLGVAYEHAGEWLQARGAYAQAIALEPRYVTARDNFMRASNKDPNANHAPEPSASAGQ